jgi:hypothetical protein
MKQKYKFESYDYSVIGINKYLKAVYSKSTLEDIRAFSNIAAEREFTAILSEQIAREVDRELLQLVHRGPINTPTYISNEEDFLSIYNNG